MTDYGGLYEEHGDFLRGYCYRLTGSVQDAKDVVQETFVRAIERPPPDGDRPWRPWLVRVATNLVRDAYRRGQREYVGSWLPEPIETSGEGAFPWRRGLEEDVEGRYEARESITLAFLLALEALSPQQRAVLLLRDVYDYSTRECAEALGLSEPNVKTTLHRARAALRDYDRRRRPPTREIGEQTAGALERLLSCFAARDAPAMEALLARDVHAISDGGGRFYAAKKPVVGWKKVALFFSNIAAEEAGETFVEAIEINGLPAVILRRPDAPERFPREWVFGIDLDAEGRVRTTYSVINPSKLGAIAGL